MRPQSIITFERLYLASLALSVVNFVLFSGYIDGEAAARTGISTTPLVVGFVIGMAIYVLLWFLIARKASVIAKWVLLVVFLLGLAQLPLLLGAPFAIANLIAMAAMALQLVAILCLFRKDAEFWLAGANDAELDD